MSDTKTDGPQTAREEMVEEDSTRVDWERCHEHPLTAANIERNPCAALGYLLQEAGVEVRIGLRAQGHLPTVERMLGQGANWHEIGRAIGWSGEAVRRWWRLEIERAEGR